MKENPDFLLETAPYTITPEDFHNGYQAYQKHFLLWKNWILEGVLALLTIDFIISACKDPNNMTAYFLILACLVAMGMLFFHPLRVRQKVMDVVKGMSEIRYATAFTEECITIVTLPDSEDEEMIPPSVLEYNSDLRIIELETLLLICDGKQRFYIMPKNALYDEQIFELREHLQEMLGKHFYSKFS